LRFQQTDRSDLLHIIEVTAEVGPNTRRLGLGYPDLYAFVSIPAHHANGARWGRRNPPGGKLISVLRKAYQLGTDSICLKTHSVSRLTPFSQFRYQLANLHVAERSPEFCALG
jgi:hypothetical protein